MIGLAIKIGLTTVIRKCGRMKGATGMRELIYGVEGKCANLRTFATDEPGQGGACHEYAIEFKDGQKAFGETVRVSISFQNGPINVDGNGVNGIQHEDLLAIIIDRLEGFQSGKYNCEENARALLHVKAALEILNDRTRARIARNVEGTHTV